MLPIIKIVDFIRSIIDWQTMIEFQNVCSLLYLSGCPCTGAVPCPMCCSAKFTYLINLLLLFFSLWLLFRRLLFLLAVFFFSPTRTYVCPVVFQSSSSALAVIVCSWITYGELFCCCIVAIGANKSNIFITSDNNSIGCEINVNKTINGNKARQREMYLCVRVCVYQTREKWAHINNNRYKNCTLHTIPFINRNSISFSTLSASFAPSLSPFHPLSLQAHKQCGRIHMFHCEEWTKLIGELWRFNEPKSVCA